MRGARNGRPCAPRAFCGVLKLLYDRSFCQFKFKFEWAGQKYTKRPTMKSHLVQAQNIYNNQKNTVKFRRSAFPDFVARKNNLAPC